MIDDGENAAARFRDLIQWLLENSKDAVGFRGSQRRIAEALGCHPSYVSRILSGKMTSIGPDVALRAARNLGLDPTFFDAAAGAKPGRFFEEPLPDAPALVSAKVQSILSTALLHERSAKPAGPPTELRESYRRAEALLDDVPGFLRRSADARADQARELAASILAWRVAREARDLMDQSDDEDAARRGLKLAADLFSDVEVFRMPDEMLDRPDDDPPDDR